MMASHTAQASSDASSPQTPPSLQQPSRCVDSSQAIDLVVGLEKDCKVASPPPTPTAVRSKRILPKHLIPVLEPGAEYSP
jgi:hypothetical protein